MICFYCLAAVQTEKVPYKQLDLMIFLQNEIILSKFRY